MTDQPNKPPGTRDGTHLRPSATLYIFYALPLLLSCVGIALGWRLERVPGIFEKTKALLGEAAALALVTEDNAPMYLGMVFLALGFAVCGPLARRLKRNSNGQGR